MADKEEMEETAPKGADWEVVSLTASTYAAAPSPDSKNPKDDQKSEVINTDKSETSNTLFMSGHFVFPPSQHENLPLGDEVSESIKEEGEKSSAKDEDNWNITKLTEDDNFHGISYEKRSEFEDTASLPGLDLTGKDESIYNSASFHSFHGEPNINDEDRVLMESVESSDSSSSDVMNVDKRMDDDDDDVPYASWWKKHAASLYSHAKEANTFWSIFIAAAVTGLVIIGQQWQQERWQLLHHKWHSGVYDEKFGRMLGPISRIKESIVGGNRRGFSIRGSSTTRNH